MHLKKIKKKIKDGIVGLLAMFTVASTVAIPATATPVVAEVAFSSDDFYRAAANLTGEAEANLKNPLWWGDWQYLSKPVYPYEGEYNNDLNSVINGDYTTLRETRGLDCVRFALALAGHAIKEAGLNPGDHIQKIGYPSRFSNVLVGSWQATTDISLAEPGDIIEYGPGSHLDVVLGRDVNGNLWTIAGSTQGYGPIIHKYTGWGSSGNQGGYFYRLYHFPHVPPTKEVSAELSKVSAEVNITLDNSAYTLAGAQYKVYEGNGTGGKLLTTLTTNESGKASASGLSVSGNTTYLTFVESAAPQGYELDATPIVISLSSNKAVCNVTETPKKQDIQIDLNKSSVEPAVTDGNASYSLAGAKYKVFYYDQYDQEVELGILTTDANGHASATYNNLPLGISKLKAVEIEASPGYELDTAEHVQSLVGGVNVFNVTEIPKKQNISVELNKSSSNPDMTDGNKCYSLEGAEYEISYLEANGSGRYVILGTVTTDANGHASATYENLPLGISKLKAVEKKASYHYALDTSDNLTVVNGTTATFNVKETPLNDPARIEIVKTDANNKTVTPDLSNAEFTFKYYDTMDAYSVEDLAGLTPTRTWVFKTIKIQGRYICTPLFDECFVSGDPIYTNMIGAFSVPFGVLTIQETKAADGYTINGGLVNSQNATISAGADDIVFFRVDSPNAIESLTYDNPFTKQEVAIHGSVEIQKHDAETGLEEVQGTTTFAGTQYDLYYIDSVVEPNKGVTVMYDTNGDGVLEEFNPGDKVKTITLDSNGYVKLEDLEAGEYKLVETKATPGYTHLDENNQPREYTFKIVEDGVTVSVDAEDTPLFGNVQLYKHFNEKPGSEVDDVPEAGAEFVFLLKSKVESDYNGDVDAAVQAVIDGTSTFTSHESSVVTTNSKGIARFKNIAIGEYYLVQTKGHVESEMLGEPYVFTVTEHDLNNPDREADPIVLSITNDWKDYIIELNKYDAVTADKIISTGAAFKIMNVETGEYVSQTVAGKAYDVFKTASVNDPDAPERFYIIPDATDADNGTVRTPLALKYGTYRITEVETPDNYITGEPFDIEVNVNEVGRVIITEDGREQSVKVVNVNNTPVEGQLTLTKIADLVDGADINLISEVDYTKVTFELRAAEDIKSPANDSIITTEGDLARDRLGNIIGNIRLDADGKAVISNIPLGKYKLVETNTFPGLALDTDVIDFEFKATDTTTPVVEEEYTIHNKETDMKFSKTDVTGTNEIAGAKMCITGAEDGQIYAEWTSTDTPTEIAGLPEGSYILSEELAPEGYVRRTSTVTFTVNGSDVSTVAMENKTFSFTKFDAAGEELPGAEMQVIDADGNVVDEWTSTNEAHRINGLVEGGTYTIHEKTAPNGYVRAIDITIDVTSDYTADQSAEMIDKIMDVTKTDVGGEELPGAILTVKDLDGNIMDTWTSTEEAHRVNNLTAGETYILSEDTAPLGYVRNTEVEFTVTDDGVNQSMFMVDKIMSISKLDVAGEELPGASLKVVDADGNVMDEWISTDEEHRVNNLTAGEEYTLIEDLAPLGYVKATSITFTVADDGENQHIDMVDKIMSTSKVDIGGKEIEGAILTVVDENGDVVDTWTSTDEEHRVVGLEAGKTYTLIEDTSPLGYVKSTEVEFTVLDDGLDQHFDLVNTIERVEKLTNDDEMLAGAVMTVVDEDGNIIDEWTTNDSIVTFTDEEKEAIADLKDGEELQITPDEHTELVVTAHVDEDDVRTYELKIATEYAVAPLSDDGPGVTPPAPETVREVSYYDIDENGNETFHRVAGLEAGKKYKIVEKESPKGYYFAQEIEFVAGEDGKDHVFTLTDQKIRYLIDKVDENGAPVKGVTLKLTDVTADREGKLLYTDENGEPIVIELPNEGVTTGEPFVLDGVLEAGHVYRLEETEWTGGLYKATDIYFNVNVYGDPAVPEITITMVDGLAKVTVNKVDAKGNPLAGAKMQILEAVEASEDDVTTDKPTDTEEDEKEENNLPILPPPASIEGDDQNDDPSAAVPRSEEDDEETKEDDTTPEVEYVPDVDEDGNVKVVYEFESTDEAGGIDVSEYVKGGKTYILREVEAPFGYNAIEDMAFTVTGTTESYQVIYAIDTPKQYDVNIVKVDADDRTKTLEGAEFRLMSATTDKVVRDVNGEPCIATSDKNGKLSFTVPYNDSMKGYYIAETKAPKDYTLDTTKYYVELTKDYTFENALKFEITNKIDRLGVSAPVKAILGGTAALIALGVAIKPKRRS